MARIVDGEVCCCCCSDSLSSSPGKKRLRDAFGCPIGLNPAFFALFNGRAVAGEGERAPAE